MGTGYEAPIKPMVYAFDAVKRITPEVSAEADPSTFRQSTYPLGLTDHMLVRFKDLLAHSSLVRLDDDNKVQVQLTVIGDPATAEAAANSISICPLTRHFMMFATWLAAHQFGSTGKWVHEGGDYDDASCVKGVVSKDNKQFLLFDVTQWFIDYPKARGANFGLIVTSTKPVTVAGDTSGSGYPRLLWSE
jgi:hypothetical protein